MIQPPEAPQPRRKRRLWLPAGLMAALATLMSACRPPAAPPAQQHSPADAGQSPAAVGPAPAVRGPASPSGATTPRAYRKDAAAHLYGLNADRIYKGKLQPLLYAIGVLEVDIDRAGRVTAVRWMRAPRHAPEVMKEIERTVREAAPFPVPARMGRVTYTDTWLWDKSGRFQLDTLTEGQL